MDEATFERIISDIAEGESMRQATTKAGINRRTLYAAMDANPSLANRYAQARKLCLASWGDDLIDVAYDPSIDPDHKRIIVDALKFTLGKLHPEYADKFNVAHSGQVTVQSINYARQTVTLEHERVIESLPSPPESESSDSTESTSPFSAYARSVTGKP